MPEGYYPIFLKMDGRTTVLIGGGHVAERKLEGLLAANASVTVVSPRISSAIAAQVELGSVSWIRREYRKGDLKGAWLVVAATGNRAVSENVAEEAQKLGVLLNVADVPELCNYYAPAVVERGDLAIAIATGGKSPAMARKVRGDVERFFPMEYGLLLDIAAEARSTLLGEGTRPAAETWQTALSSDLIELIRAGDLVAAKAKLLDALRVKAGV